MTARAHAQSTESLQLVAVRGLVVNLKFNNLLLEIMDDINL